MIGEKPGEVFIGRDLANMGNVAAASLELVDSETRRLVHEAEETSKRILALNAAVLEDLANSLMQAETLSGPSLDVYMEAVKRWPEPLLDGPTAHTPPIHPRVSTEDDGSALAGGDAGGDSRWDDEA
jgi:hypothetical protein